MCFAYCDYCMPSRTDCYECFTSVPMKLSSHYFAAIVIVQCKTANAKLQMQNCKCKTASAKLQVQNCKCQTASAMYAYKNIGNLETLLRKRTF